MKQLPLTLHVCGCRESNCSISIQTRITNRKVWMKLCASLNESPSCDIKEIQLCDLTEYIINIHYIRYRIISTRAEPYHLSAFFSDEQHSFTHVMKLITLTNWTRRKILKKINRKVLKQLDWLKCNLGSIFNFLKSQFQ